MSIFEPIYLILFVFILGLNVMPAFMPPTWLVLAFFFIKFHLNLFSTVLIGAIAATLGRVLLATLAKNYFRGFFHKRTLANYDFLGDYFRKREHLTVPLVFTYAFFPIPSNQVFILVGLANLRLRYIAFSFLVGRLLSYTFWVKLSSIAQNRLETIFASHFSSWGSLIGDIASLAIIYLIGKISWKRLLSKH